MPNKGIKFSAPHLFNTSHNTNCVILNYEHFNSKINFDREATYFFYRTIILLCEEVFVVKRLIKKLIKKGCIF